VDVHDPVTGTSQGGRAPRGRALRGERHRPRTDGPELRPPCGCGLPHPADRTPAGQRRTTDESARTPGDVVGPSTVIDERRV